MNEMPVMQTIGNPTSIYRLNIHYAIFLISQNIADLFIGVVLFGKGLPLRLIFLFFIVSNLTKIFSRFSLTLPFVRKYGLMAGVITGALLYVLFYLLFSLTHQLSVPMLLVFAVANGLVGTMYWVAVHPLYAQTSQLEQDGRNIGYRDALIRLGGIVGPLFSGFIAATYGSGFIFVLAAGLSLVSLLPLLGQQTSQSFALGEAQLSNIKILSRDSFLIGFYDGVFTFSQEMVWALVIFLLFGNSYAAFGAFFSFIMLVRALGNIVVGHAIDNHYRQRLMLTLSIGAIVIILVVKMFLRTVSLAIVVDAALMIALTVYNPIFLTAFYRTHRNSANPLLSVAVSDTGYDTAVVIVSVAGAGLTWFGLSIQLAMVLGLLAMIGNWFLLREKVGGAGAFPDNSIRI